jgi:hypothetical protein
MCVLIFSTTFVWNIYHSKKKWASRVKKRILVFIVKYCIFISSGALRHCSHAGLLYPYPALNKFRNSTPDALHTKRREKPLLAKDGTKSKE